MHLQRPDVAGYTEITVPSLIVGLLPRLEAFVAAQVRAREYPTREAAIIGAVAHEKRCVEQRARLRTQLQNGLASGMSGALDFEDVIRRGRGKQPTEAGVATDWCRPLRDR